MCCQNFKNFGLYAIGFALLIGLTVMLSQGFASTSTSLPEPIAQKETVKATMPASAKPFVQEGSLVEMSEWEETAIGSVYFPPFFFAFF